MEILVGERVELDQTNLQQSGILRRRVSSRTLVDCTPEACGIDSLARERWKNSVAVGPPPCMHRLMCLHQHSALDNNGYRWQDQPLPALRSRFAQRGRRDHRPTELKNLHELYFRVTHSDWLARYTPRERRTRKTAENQS